MKLIFFKLEKLTYRHLVVTISFGILQISEAENQILGQHKEKSLTIMLNVL